MVIQTEQLLGFLFPGNAMINALLATTYISIIPNALLYFVPKNVNPATLSLLVNFAGGSLLGDLFLHLLPHIFGGRRNQDKQQDIAIGDIDYKHMLIGTSVFLGVFIFYATDKCLKSYFKELSYEHVHSKEVKETEENITVEPPKKRYNLRPRKGENKQEEVKVVKKTKKSTIQQVHQIRPSTYLNLLADFIHNLTDGMVLAASFYISPTVGATTTMAVFFHEIPHEINDFIFLLKSGFTKTSALRARFTTTLGAYIGTFVGIGSHEMAKYLETVAKKSLGPRGLFGTTVEWNDAIISVIAGGFFYVAIVGIIPEMLNTKSKDRIQPIKELSSMLFGLVIMAYISWNEQKQIYQ